MDIAGYRLSGSSARRLRAAAAIAVLSVVACLARAASSEPVWQSQDATGSSYALGQLVRDLQAAGEKVKVAGRYGLPFFDVASHVMRVNGSEPQLLVLEYPDELARAAASQKISSDGHSIGGRQVWWTAQPNFWARGRVIVLYLGRDPEALAMLTGILGASVTDCAEQESVGGERVGWP